ncbi:MAG: hypothetical protein JSR71_03470 [Proteobacteria bacterium]|nr:hypothetical protein [Pseudomonadota bacterium]
MSLQHTRNQDIAQVIALLPLDHQQVSQARVVKGICDDRHGPLPSLLPSSDKSFV